MLVIIRCKNHLILSIDLTVSNTEALMFVLKHREKMYYQKIKNLSIVN